MSGFIQGLLALPMLVALLTYGRVRVPKAFIVWLFFLGWVLVSASQLAGADIDRWGAYLWRTALYVSSTVIFLYVFNASRESLPARKIVKIMAAFWALTVIGGFIGMLAPKYDFTSPVEAALPDSLVRYGFISDLVHPETTRGNPFAGTRIFRPKMPFIWSNQWGSVFALTLPFAIGGLAIVRSRLWRDLLVALMIASIMPLVFTLSRGGWLSTAAVMLYSGFRLATGRDARGARALIIGAALVAGVLLLTPLGSVITYRLERGYGDQTRSLLIDESLSLTIQSPVFGYGAPVDTIKQYNPRYPSVGTHGQAWLLLVSHGIPGFALFMVWFLYVLAKTGWHPRARGRRDYMSEFWCHVVVAAGLVQIGYYELLPWQIPIMMMAAAVALREVRVEPRPWRFRLAYREVPRPARSLTR